ncbi:MAG TPA: AgmX/PglI C-terminal domain-containing protein [Labilithrix sp.]|nr:AgmX/PglI C-terminal domain-containing protein [Labilithrix sp.]
MTTHAFESPFRPYNPFIASEDDALELEDVADARDVSYALIPRGPAVSPEEVESHLDVVEVKIRWGTQVLSLAHVEAGKSFTIGEGGDFAVADLVRERVVESRAGATYAVVPTGATATVNVKGEHPRSGAAGEEIALAEGTSVTIDLAPITIELATVRAGKKVPVGFLAALASGAAAAIGLSFVGHTAIIASLAMFMPAMHADDAESISRDQILKMQAMLDASAEREKDLLKNQELASEEPTGGGSKGGEPHQGESGAAGKTTPVTTNGHMAFRGSDDRVRLARREELDLAANGGLIGILRSGVPETGPSSPWATETQLGQDADNKIGAMFGADPNDAMGYGLGLWGTGEGGGGKGAGIGIDGVGATVGGGGGGPGKWGIGPGDKNGWGNGHGPGGGGHVAKAPIIRTPDVSTNGRLPAEVIQRIVRQNFGRFRLCYEAGLRSNPGLTGRVVTKFVIGRDGAVAQAQDAGSDIPSQEVVSCVVRSFNNLSFPQPQGGIAMVTYPIILSPGE